MPDRLRSGMTVRMPNGQLCKITRVEDGYAIASPAARQDRERNDCWITGPTPISPRSEVAVISDQTEIF